MTSTRRRLVLLGLAASAVTLGASGSALLRRGSHASGGPRPSGPAVLSERSVYQLGSTWTSDDGRELRLAELAGSTQVLAMMFTSCASVCPTLVRELRRLEGALPAGARAHFLLVSIDPERDTPEALRRYRSKMGLDRERWTLLRGQPADVRELAQVLGVAYAKTEGAEIAHSRLVTVLDPGGEVVHQQAGVADDPARLLDGIARAEATGIR